VNLESDPEEVTREIKEHMSGMEDVIKKVAALQEDSNF